MAVRVQPRARTNEVVGLHGEALKVRLTPPPVDGAANAALIKLLAATFDVTPGAVTIVSGEGSRTKLVQLDGVSEPQIRHMLRDDE